MRLTASQVNMPRMDAADLIAKYDRPVPRYTSYPTAPHFSNAVTAATYARWLRGITDGTPLSLYLHVPFCAALCRFCACHTTVVNHTGPLAAYARTLLDEIDLVADAIGRRLPVRHIHWGGGTPTALPAEWMLAVADRLRLRFDLADDVEIAVEIDPRTLSDPSLAALALMGTTRVSLGVQDFDPLVQQTVNRIQTFETTDACAGRLREIGIASLNLDLIYGLPHQTTAGVTRTVEQALRLAPDRVAVFGYAHVPWMKKQQSLLPEDALPDPWERYAQRQAVDDVVIARGYQRIGLDHLARRTDGLARAAGNGRLRRNFQGYTTDDAPVLLGLGASSIGSLPDGYAQNAASVPLWRDAVRAGRLPIARGIALSSQDRLRRDVIEHLMCRLTVDLRAVAACHAADPETLLAAAPALAEQAGDGLIEWDGNSVAVTPAGQPFVRTIAAVFDAYLGSGATRHSAAV
jgi:oxygen-independent coproporphyrinogen III oxidase